MEKTMSLAIAIDGPAGAGKSTIAKMIAGKRDLLYLDTGAMYRACALKAIRSCLSCKDAAKVEEMLEDTVISILFDQDHCQQIYLDGENVSTLIRTPEVSTGASDISAIPAVRRKMVDIQRDIAKDCDVIMDGRDIGTFVLPDAGVKIFLTASVEERARRRLLEFHQKGRNDVTFEEVKKEMEYRDYNDSHRDFAPLKKAEDAIEIDTTAKSIEEVVEEIIAVIEKNAKKNH
jgi:cytidylate kinase